MSEAAMDWPPPYTLRRSKRASRISLRVSEAAGLELVLPEKNRQPDIAAILERHRPWIERQLTRRAARAKSREGIQRPSPFLPPAGFWLHGGGLRIDLDIGKGLGGAAMQELIRQSQPEGTYIWPLPALDEKRLLIRLNTLIKHYARHYLQARVNEVSGQSGLGYSCLFFATQKRRWGSYAPGGTIRLNHKLIFLPPSLADYVILHELCHSLHHNHGSAFWDLLRGMDPEISKKNADLRQAEICVPTWFS